MKKYSFIYFIMLCVISYSFFACGGDDDVPSNNNPQNPISSFVSLKGLQVSDLIVDASKRSTSVSINNKDITGCQVTSSASWCVAEIAGTNLNLQIEENTSYEDRKSIITLTQPKDNSSLSFNVIQSKNSVIQVEKDIYEVSEAGGTITINVKSNVDYIVDLGGIDWITLNSTRALQSSTVQLVVAANNSGNSREAIVTIKDKDGKVSRSITITQTFTAQIIIDKDSYTVSEEGGSLTIGVKSNVDYTVDLGGYNWMTANITRSLNNSTVTLLVQANNTGNERVAVIQIKDKNSSLSKKITIKQNGISNIVVSPSSVSMYYEDTKQLSATPAATSWSVENDFIAKVDNNGLVTARHIGTTNVVASKGSAKGICKVTVKPKYTAYDTPILAWGSSLSTIKSAETHTLSSSSTSTLLAYNYTFGSNVCVVGYSFKDSKLNSVIAMMAYSSTLYLRIGYYLLERYQPIGQEGTDYYFIDAMDPNKATTAVVLGLSSSYITVTYLQFTYTSSSAPVINKIKAIQQNNRQGTEKMAKIMLNK